MGPLRLVPLGFQQISAATLATATPLTVPTGATVALIGALGAPINWRDDGTAPTASIGMPIATGTFFEYYGSLSAIKLILGSGSPTANISYYAVAG